MMRFEWNQTKARANLRKHRVSFEEAQTVFYDDLAVQFYDESTEEERFIMLGKSGLSRVLVVVHCERGEDDSTIRIISARKATKAEKRHYPG